MGRGIQNCPGASRHIRTNKRLDSGQLRLPVLATGSPFHVGVTHKTICKTVEENLIMRRYCFIMRATSFDNTFIKLAQVIFLY